MTSRVFLAIALCQFGLPALAQTLGEDIFRDGFDPAPPPPANDTCQTAATLLANGPTVFGATTGATNNYDSGLEAPTCTGYAQAGADVAYAVMLISGQNATVTLSNVSATFDASISLVGPAPAANPSTICTTTPIPCLKGADVNGFGFGETFSYSVTTTGTYYIIVDSFYTGRGDSGTFSIAVTTQ